MTSSSEARVPHDRKWYADNPHPFTPTGFAPLNDTCILCEHIEDVPPHRRWKEQARVPHDPNDLRTAARLVHFQARNRPLADRLEAWADNMEREPEADLLAEVKRHRDANLVRAVLDGYGDQDEIINEAINVKDFDRVPWLVAQKAVDYAQRLAPLEAAVLDAAKKLRDAIFQTGDLRNPANGEADLVAVWNKGVVLSARLADLDAALQEANDDH